MNPLIYSLTAKQGASPPLVRSEETSEEEDKEERGAKSLFPPRPPPGLKLNTGLSPCCITQNLFAVKVRKETGVGSETTECL
uniref:Uncharacterized protein n=1 Tax=Noccaea caerulescens TaxID=107243 RepID=A0A1J3J5D3_NOCCA